MKTPFGTDLGEDADSPTRRRWIPLVLGALALSLLVGSAFAASITINDGDPIEFGQGRQLTPSCDDDIDASLYPTSYGTSIEDLAFRIDYVMLRNVDLSACSGKVFTLTFKKADGTNVGVCDVADCSGLYDNAGDAIVKFMFTSCNGTNGSCTVTYYGNPVKNNGIAEVYTGVATTSNLGTGTIEIDVLWKSVYWTACDPVHPALCDKRYVVLADSVAGITVETSEV